MEELQSAAVLLMSLCRGEQNAGCERKGCFENPGKEGEEGGLKMGEGGRKGDCNTQATGSAAGQ